MSEEVLGMLKNSVACLDPEEVQKNIKEALDLGIPPAKIVSQGMARGMDIVGKKFEAKEFFLAELVMAGEIMKEGVEFLKPHMKEGDMPIVGRVVVGTVRGDLHDIGKDIFVTFLKAAGFEVIDLGVDVPPEDFIKAVKEHNPTILAMSALLTLTLSEMEEVLKMLESQDLKKKVKVIIGGASTTQEFASRIRADWAAKDAVEGVSICKGWIESE